MKIEEFDFGTTKNGEIVKGIRISNEKDLEFSVINRGATLISLKLADKSGTLEECVLGFDNITDYENHSPFFGATIGRVGNRIGGAKYTLDGTTYDLSVNDKDRNHLHGGKKGFDKVIWDLNFFEEEGSAVIKCNYESKDGEENYPGNLKVEVQYILTSENELILQYWAQTDKKTPVNLTNHTYWNLSGNKKENIKTHKLQIEAESYLPVDEYSIPTGEIAKVESTPYDFRQLKELGPMLEETGGFDHNFNLSDGKKRKPINRIYVEHEKSGRTMEILTTEPGVQFYSGNNLYKMKDQGFDTFDALCLETQMYPDSVNQRFFPSIILSPEELYRQKTIHRFSIKK
ncbi:MAG: galactose mutarotase [Spirochaetaceae bacterium]|jgi:aldose 1-epimerase|nr:galactose mutarotase [Spirochaetaceae bacterium]